MNKNIEKLMENVVIGRSNIFNHKEDKAIIPNKIDLMNENWKLVFSGNNANTSLEFFEEDNED